MAIGKRRPVQPPLFVSTASLDLQPHPFYAAVNKILDAHHFDAFAEWLCSRFYDDPAKGSRPGLSPAIYFRCLMLGYFEGIDSDRGITWRGADSLSIKALLGIPLDKATPDHSTISLTRRLIDVETHAGGFQFILKVLVNHRVIDGKTVGVDSTTLEANAAMRSIVGRDTSEGYQDFLARLAKESGIETPTRDDLAKFDRKRKNKASNDDWENPSDPDAKITKMKDGTTHLAHKAEHAVDLGEDGHGAVLAVRICDAAVGDTATLAETLVAATANLAAVRDDTRVADKLGDDFVSEVVAGKGYHSRQTLADLGAMNLRSYASEPGRGGRGRQKWKGDEEAQAAAYANRRRIKSERGRRLLRRRGEFLERSFAHCYETGGMRRLHLRGRENIAKRALIHAGGFNLGVLMRVYYKMGKPRGACGRAVRACCALVAWLWGVWAVVGTLMAVRDAITSNFSPDHRALRLAAA
ncbi:MAG: transposase [Tepidisphaerales bacterium]